MSDLPRDELERRLRDVLAECDDLRAQLAERDRMLAGRDSFIVDRGLWNDFVNTLDRARALISGEPK